MIGCSENENMISTQNNESDEIKKEEPIEKVYQPDFTVFEYINTYKETFEKPDNEIGILRVDIKYPSIKNASEKESYLKINNYYKDAYETMRDYISTDALTYAKEDMKAAEAIEGHFINHYLNVSYKVTYEDSEKVSILIQASAFAGGAHGSHWLEGKTFDLNTGESLKIHEVLGLDLEVAKAYVFKAIEAELNKAENKEIYYEDALEIYQDAYNFEDFYLEDDHLVIFFQSYALAPYVAGLPSFILNYPEK
jgi:hypothetical protein